jgi:hypothetical protein
MKKILFICLLLAGCSAPTILTSDKVLKVDPEPIVGDYPVTYEDSLLPGNVNEDIPWYLSYVQGGDTSKIIYRDGRVRFKLIPVTEYRVTHDSVLVPQVVYKTPLWIQLLCAALAIALISLSVKQFFP